MFPVNHEKKCDKCGAIVDEQNDGFCKKCGEFFDETKTRWFNNGPDEIHISDPH
jgi:hypothetical protein